MNAVPVTLIVPTWNGGALFRRVLEAIRRLDPAPAALLVVDSESDDGSDSAAERAGATVLRIRRRDFDHGATRQMAVERAASELVAFLSQDALPEPRYLGALAGAFADPRVAGATARILPHDDSSPLARRTVLAAPLAAASPRVISVDEGSLDGLDPAARRRLCLFDNVASMARRHLLLEMPFPRTMMGEDADFAARALARGYRLAFVPDAVVRHAHEYGPAAAFRRYRDDARWARLRFGERVRRSPWSVIRGFAYEVREDWRYLKGGAAPAREWLRSPLLRAAQVFGQWWGSNTRAAS